MRLSPAQLLRPLAALALSLLPPSGARAQEPAAAEGEADKPELIPPELTNFVHADYPPQARAEGVQAAVKLAIQVDEAGKVAAVEVLEPAGHGFDEAAVAAAEQFEFSPARYGEEAVAVKIRFTYRFVLEEEERPVEPPGPEEAPIPTVRGEVLLRGERTPLGDLLVRVPDSEHAVQTDEAGRFELALPPGTWIIEVVHPLYEPFSTEEEVVEGEALDVTYYVESKQTSRYHTVVRAKRPKKTVTRTKLEDVELVQVPGTFGEPFRVVQTLPGVARMPFGMSFLIVRGANPEDSAVLLDEFLLPDMYHFLSGPALVNAELVESIEFFPGNYPLAYGWRQSGLVTATTRGGPPGERLRGNVSVDFLDLEGIVHVPIGDKSEVSVAARRSHIDLLIGAVTDGTVRPRYWDYQVLGRTRRWGWRAQLMLLGAADALDYSEEPESQDDPGTSFSVGVYREFHQLQGRAKRSVFGDGSLEISGAAGAAWFDTAFDDDTIHSGYELFSARAKLDKPLFEDVLALQVGTALIAVHNTLELRLPGVPNFTAFPTPQIFAEDPEQHRTDYEFDEWAYAPAAWVSLEATLGRLTVIPGVRAGFVTVESFDDLVLDPRLVARLKVAEPVWLKAGVGIFHQMINGQALTEDWGSPHTIQSPHSLQRSFGAEVHFTEWLEIDTSVFWNSYRELVVAGKVTESAGQVQSGEAFTNDGEGRAFGLEFLLRHKLRNGCFGWISYTLSRSERRGSTDEEWALFNLDQTHILTAVASYDVGWGVTAGLRFQLVSGVPRTPILGSVYDADTNSFDPVLGAAQSDRNPAFHQLDLRVDKLFTFDTFKLTAYLDLQNVYNQANTEFTAYSYDFSESAVISGLPILPSLGVKAEF